MKTIKFYIESLGCAKNQVDSEIIIAALCRFGYLYEQTPEQADFIIVNTCGFIEPAKEESIVTALEFRKQFPGKKLIMTGCLIQRYQSALQEDLPEIDGFFGNRDPERIAESIDAVITNRQDTIDPSDICRTDQPVIRTRLLSHQGSAYVKISEGCDNRCAYCAIPLIRGSLQSRKALDITGEIRQLLQTGIKEIVLVAQDTGSYGLDRAGKQELRILLESIASIDASFWVRLLYIHPDRFPHDILDLIKADARFLSYFDIPFQHASEKILKKMGRKGSAEASINLIDTIRNTLPHAVIRSTFLIGFPGETDRDFQILEDFRKKAELDWLGVFAYSKEEGTPAYGFPGRVGKQEAVRRKKIIEENQIKITENRLSRFIGKELDVLVEENVEGEDLSIGRGYMHAPDVDGLVVVNGKNVIPGSIIRVRIIRRNNLDLEAVII